MQGRGSSQQGGGIPGLLATILVFGLLVSVSLKVTPTYLDDYALKKILASLNESSDGEAYSVNAVRNRINKGLATNLVRLTTDEMKIYREDGSINVDIDYERRVDFLYNIDLILTFKHDWKAKIQ